MTVTGTLTLANGKLVKATKWNDGSVTWEQLKTVRHGSGTSTGGFVQRKATPKQAATFVLDGWIVDAERAEVLAYAEMTARGVKVLADIVKAEMNEPVAYARISNLVHLAEVASTASARAFWARKAAARQAA